MDIEEWRKEEEVLSHCVVMRLLAISLFGGSDDDNDDDDGGGGGGGDDVSIMRRGESNRLCSATLLLVDKNLQLGNRAPFLYRDRPRSLLPW